MIEGHSSKDPREDRGEGGSGGGLGAQVEGQAVEMEDNGAGTHRPAAAPVGGGRLLLSDYLQER